MADRRPPRASRPARQRTWLPWLIFAAGVWAYHNSFHGPFIFDDLPTIVNNPHLRHLWPLSDTLVAPPQGGLTGRPVVSVSLALNYAFGALDVRGYHAVNLAIHLAAGLALFGLIRRTLLTPSLRARYGAAAPWLALASALLWVVHPLQTESVTYIIQRSESLMGLWALLTLYGLARSGTSSHPGRWLAAAVVSCALGMGSKAVMGVVPIAAVLYDRVFMAGSFARAMSQRRSFYLGLAATWSILVAGMVHTGRLPRPAAGFGFKEISPVMYAMNQPGAILHYLRLAVWPVPLCLDYAWPAAKTAGAIVWSSAVVGGLLAAVGWAWRRRPALGFLGAAFFMALAPTSSVMPIRDLVSEHRMYLPLACVSILAAVGAWEALQRLRLTASMRRQAAAGLLIAVVGIFGMLTIRRNADYRSELAIWNDVVAKRPNNARAHNNLAVIFGRQGEFDQAVAHGTKALELKTDYADAYNNLGTFSARSGQIETALAHYHKALALEGGYAEPYNNIGLLLLEQGKPEAAMERFLQAILMEPGYPDPHHNIGLALAQQGRLADAIPHYTDALRLRPDFSEAHNNLGLALAGTGRLDEAIPHYAEATHLEPDFVEAYNNWGLALAGQARWADAAGQYDAALRLRPDFAEGHNNLGIVLANQGRLDDAAQHFSRAIALKPDYRDARHNLSLIQRRLATQ